MPESDGGFPLWDDNPTDSDLLGFASLAAPAREALTRVSLDPVCVGVFGPWGSGKTSVAMQIERELKASKGVLPIYVEPWGFDPATDPKARLIGLVLSAINAKLKELGTLTDDLRTAIGKLAKRVRWSRAVRLAAKTALTAQLPSFDDLGEFFKGDDDAPLGEPSIDGFRDEFERLMASEALGEITRVVVIVDDLDRCLPDTVVDVLEGIKLFLAVPKMAFLVAADEKAVRFAIATRYAAPRVRMEREAMDLAVRYLDKIVQIPIRLPALSLADVEAYVLQLLLLQDDGEQDAWTSVSEHCDQRRRSGEESFIDELGDAVDAEHVALAKRLAPVLYEGMDGNPRRIKRFLNELWLRSVLATARGLDVDHSAVAKLMVLEQVHEPAFEEMLGWVRAGIIEERLASLQGGAGDASIQLRRWVQMEPRALDPASVRKYLVLAASLRGATIPVESLPSHLREPADQLLSSRDDIRRRAVKDAKKLSDEDRSILGVHVVEAVQSQPNRQAELAEVVADLANSGTAVEASIVDALRKMRVSDVDVPLVINLAPPGVTVSKVVLDLLSLWEADPDLSAPARRAVAQTLEGK